MIEVRVGSVKASGPLFDVNIQVDGARYVDEAIQQVALEGRDGVRTLGMSQYQEPTGYYRDHVVVRRESAERAVVHDSMVVYGPWLEGVGSRNAVTRFKGYRTWRLTRQTLAGKAPAIAIHVLKRYLPRWGG
jgi:hypothetical protein